MILLFNLKIIPHNRLQKCLATRNFNGDNDTKCRFFMLWVFISWEYFNPYRYYNKNDALVDTAHT